MNVSIICYDIFVIQNHSDIIIIFSNTQTHENNEDRNIHYK